MQLTDFQAMIVGAMVRHALTSLATLLVALGALKGADSASFVQIGSGIAIWAVTFAWSWWQKRGHALVLSKFLALKQAKGG